MSARIEKRGKMGEWRTLKAERGSKNSDGSHGIFEEKEITAK